ncbi:MAG: aldehyde dehydrogenase family protein, partial [Candidatus Hadarchaeota archaeon]
MYINGNWIEKGDREIVEVTNPSTGEVIEKIVKADDEDLEEAVDAAESAFDDWRN